MRKAACLVMGAVVVLSLALTACSQKVSTPIKLGLVDSFTGGVAQQCALLRDGALIAVDEINAAGGIKGRTVEVIVQDDGLDVAKTTAIGKQFKERDKVNIIIGASASTTALAMAKFADANKMPAISTQAASEDLVEYKYLWRTFTTNSEFARATLQYAKDLGYTKVAVSYVNLAWGIDLKTMTQKYAPEYGITVVAAEGIESGATDALIQAKKMKDAGAQVILNPDYAGGVLALGQARKALGWNVPVVAIDTTFTPALRAADPVLFEGYYVVGFQDFTNPRVISVFDAYEKKFGSRLADSNILGGYDTAMLAMTALKNASNPDDPASVQKALESIKDFPQVRGKTNQSSSFTTDRRYLIRATDLVQAIVRKGEIVPR